MRPTAKNFIFKLYEEKFSDELLIQKIRKEISTLPVSRNSFIIVELFDLDAKLGIPFFQAIHEREFKKTELYCFEVRLNLEIDGKIIWKIYRKSNQTKEQVLQAFEEICVKRIDPDLADWEEIDICSENKNPKDKNLKLLNNMYHDYFSIDLPTEIDNIKYWEALRYVVDNSDNYKGDKWVSLAEQYCINGQYEKAKEIYEMVTFASEATYQLADMIMTGKLGKPNYKLAYEYYNHTCLIDELHYLGAKIKIAKMHRDGKYFKPNYLIYKKTIKDLEKELLKCDDFCQYLDELYYELASIEQYDGNNEQAINYCLKACNWVKDPLIYGGNEHAIVNAIKIFKLLYSLTEFDVASANAFDLLYLLNSPLNVLLVYENMPYNIESFYDKGYLIINFNENHYRGPVNFFLKATLDGHRFLHEANKITIIEVTQ
ncbi:MAG: sel1 repeat family protein [Clostridia bacterium]|nr:sel1 repeat family protein [Clostridia bacterium]